MEVFINIKDAINETTLQNCLNAANIKWSPQVTTQTTHAVLDPYRITKTTLLLLARNVQIVTTDFFRVNSHPKQHENNFRPATTRHPQHFFKPHPYRRILFNDCTFTFKNIRDFHSYSVVLQDIGATSMLNTTNSSDVEIKFNNTTSATTTTAINQCIVAGSTRKIFSQNSQDVLNSTYNYLLRASGGTDNLKFDTPLRYDLHEYLTFDRTSDDSDNVDSDNETTNSDDSDVQLPKKKVQQLLYSSSEENNL